MSSDRFASVTLLDAHNTPVGQMACGPDQTQPWFRMQGTPNPLFGRKITKALVSNGDPSHPAQVRIGAFTKNSAT